MNLTSKYTNEQIMAAKKTITVQIEVDGEVITEIHDGTKGFAVITAGEGRTSSIILASGENTAHFATAMLKEIADRYPIILIPVVMAALGHKGQCEAEKQNKTACH